MAKKAGINVVMVTGDNLKTAIRTLKPEEQNNSWVEGIKYVIKNKILQKQIEKMIVKNKEN